MFDQNIIFQKIYDYHFLNELPEFKHQKNHIKIWIFIPGNPRSVFQMTTITITWLTLPRVIIWTILYSPFFFTICVSIAGEPRTQGSSQEGAWILELINQVDGGIDFFPVICFHVSKSNNHLSHYSHLPVMTAHAKLGKHRGSYLLCRSWSLCLCRCLINICWLNESSSSDKRG